MSKNMSIVRWAGGKSWFVPYFKKITKKLEYNSYFEPFLGGASIFLSSVEGHDAYLSDINSELISAYIEVRDNPDKLIETITGMPISEEKYYDYRTRKPHNEIEKAARFLYLNHTSFNGIYRVNAKGEYNVPYGKRHVPYDTSKIYFASKKFAKATLEVGDFDRWGDMIREKDLVFLDPPYSVSNMNKENGFIGYHQKLFSLDDQKRLRRFIDLIRERKAYYILTNTFHDEILNIFSIVGDCCIPVQRACVIGGTNARRGNVMEYMFTNIPKKYYEEDDGYFESVDQW